MARARSMAAACAVAGAVALAGVPAATAAGRHPDKFESTMLHAIDKTRAAHGRHRLTLYAGLERVAEQHSRAMAQRDFFGHRSVDGASFSERVRAHVDARRVGEILAISKGIHPKAEVDAIMNAWLHSPTHRRELLRRGYRRVGVAAVDGSNGTLWTVDFATRQPRHPQGQSGGR